MNTTVIYHSADYDGIFCREIARHFLGDKDVNYIGWNFGNPPIPVPDKGEGDLIVMDLPLDKPFGWPMPLIHLRGGATLTWIDHHKSAIEVTPTDIPGYRIDGVAACRLAWQWFAHPSGASSIGKRPSGLPDKQQFIDRTVSEPLAVRLAGEYDIWDHRGDGDLEFQFGLDSLVSIDWGELLDQDRSAYCTYIIVSAGQAAMNCYAKRDADVMRDRSYLTEWNGLKFLTLNTARCNSNTFAARDVPEIGHDALLAYYFNGKCWTVSLYHAKHRTDLDLSQIAVKHGGGGHRGACGFTCDKLPFKMEVNP